MQRIDTMEVGKRIGYWQYKLSRIEDDMLKLQSRRMDMKETLVHLHRMQDRASP